MRWLTRDDLGAAGRGAGGLLVVSPDAASVFPLGEQDAALTGAALKAAGVGPSDRVVVALAEPAGSLWAGAAAGVAAAAASVGPRGRLRLHHALSALGATTLVATPTGAMDFLARLHLEFLLDPLDLGLRHLVLTGEIAARRTLSHLASEFEATVTEVLSSPFSGGALACRTAQEEAFAPLAADTLALAAPGKDAFEHGEHAEVVLTPRGHPVLGDAVLRTGYVSGGGLAPEHTVGEHVLVRGVWVSLPRLEKALSKIDGVSGWELTISRQGTLDAAVLTVSFARQSLVGNPMWKGRVTQALQALTPVSIEVEIAREAAESAVAGVVTDLRGHHLGRDRALLA
ncbi:hypothetical protein OIE66_30200 [Nonomuraea sp. NBC_01738]|uniref:hypothetical protein n=1 Tax=Nonomuraea sp. NBC_01738 TaxID=2976003 RepID=UPI002E160570|nr:hypothetical protein OIE66_30200 [Nonomuraea sp. NBC_01738]